VVLSRKTMETGEQQWDPPVGMKNERKTAAGSPGETLTKNRKKCRIEAASKLWLGVDNGGLSLIIQHEIVF